MLGNLNKRMLIELMTNTAKERTPTSEAHRKSQTDLLETLKYIGQNGDVQTILSAEKSILNNELRQYGNSKGMNSSLSVAINDLTHAEKHLKIVNDPKRYAEVDELFQRPKNRRSGVPYDEARQFFSSHSTRLLNQDRSRLSDTEKKSINARRTNLRKAEKVYISLQQNVLKIEPKEKALDRGQSR